MTDNFFDQYDNEDAGAPSLASSHVKAPENFFDELDGEAPAPELTAPRETIVPKTTPGRSWRDDLIDGVSIGNARESARTLSKAERVNPRVQPAAPEASFWEALEHAAGYGNMEAYAGTLEHLRDMTGEKYWGDYADGIRKSVKDGSAYKPIYESYKQIGGLKDLWGYVKETAGQQIGVMLPSIAAGTALGTIGASQGMIVGGPRGGAIGGAAGGVAGAILGTVHHHINDMREALKKEGVNGENLTKFTNMGAAVLVSLDAVFPAAQAMKLGGFARKSVAQKVAQKLVQNLAEGGKMRTAAEFVKAFGKDVIKDAVLLEVPTELAQQAVTDFGAKVAAGKDVTKGDLEKFALETAPETIFRTIIGAGAMAVPGSAAKSYRDVRDAKADAVFPGDKPSGGAGEAQVDGIPPEVRDGTPVAAEAAEAEPRVDDASKGDAPPPIDGKKGVGVLQFIRSSGGLVPDGELDALDAGRYPGLVNQGGLSADEMRERLVEAGYLEETGPDQPAITTPADVYDMIGRAMAGERIVPLEDQQDDAEFFASQDARDQFKELTHAEKLFVLPALEQTAEETGDPVMTQAYKQLQPDERMEVIDRTRRGEDAVNVIEEIVVRNVNSEMISAMVAVYGPNPELIDRVRTLIAKQQPELLAGFDELVAGFQTRRPKVPRQPVRKPGEEPSALVRSMGDRLKAVSNDQAVFDLAMSEMERDRKILKADAYEIATSYLGYAPKKTGTKASYFQAIRDAQAKVARPAAELNYEAQIRQAAASEAAATIDGPYAEDVASTKKRFADNPQVLAAIEKMDAAMVELREAIRRGDPQIRLLAQRAGDLGAAVEELGVPKTKLATQWAKSVARQLPLGKDQVVEQFGAGQDSAEARAVTPENNLAAPAAEVAAPGREPLPGTAVRGLPEKPAIPVKFSVQPGFVGSLIDGSRHIDLRRHLKGKGIDVEDYAKHFRLGDDYQLVAPNRIAAAYDDTARTMSYDDFAKRYTIGAEKMKGVEAVQRAIQAGDSAGLATALKGMNKRRLAEMAAKLEISDKDPAKAIAKRFTSDIREAAKSAHTREIMGGTDQQFADDAKRADALRGDTIRQFMAAADPSVAVPAAEGQQAATPPENLTAELIKLANSKTPHTEWAATLGVSPHELHRAATDAVQAGILMYDKRGRLVRAPMDQNKNAAGILAEFEQLMSETVPTDESGKPAAAAVRNWLARGQQLAEQIKRIPLADAQSIAAKLAGRKVGKTEIGSRPKIAAIMWDRLRSLGDSRLKLGMQKGSAAMIAPGMLANETVMLTPEAMSKVDALQDAVDEAVGDILPASVRVDVVDSIAIARLAREDELLSLRSSRRATLEGGAEASDGQLSETGAEVAGEGGDASAQQRSEGGAARDGQGSNAAGRGNASGLAGAAVERIVRQESAPRRADGSVIVGRPRKGDGLEGGASDAPALRPGETEIIRIGEGRGRVTAIELEQSDILTGNLARLNYEALDGFRMIGKMELVQRFDGAWEVDFVTSLRPRQGVATRLYDAVEADLGIRMSPSGLLSKEGLAFWKKRSPASVQWHTPASTMDGFYYSPAFIKRELDRIGRELTRLTRAEGTAARIPEKTRNELIEGYRKERGLMIKQWGKLPADARAAAPTMFSLTAYHGTLHHFDRFSLDRIGTGEGAQAFGHGLYFAENKQTAEYYRKALSGMGRDGPKALIVNGERIDVNDSSVLQWIASELSVFQVNQTDGVFSGEMLDSLEQLLTENSEYLRYDLGLDTLDPAEEKATIKSGLDLLKKLEGAVVEFPRDDGALYEVKLDVEPEQLLDWDEPLSEQSPQVQEAIRALGIEPVPFRDGAWLNSELYRRLDVVNRAEVSDAMLKAGISGIRYRDAGSRDFFLDGKKVTDDDMLQWVEDKLAGRLGVVQEYFEGHLERLRKEVPTEEEATGLFTTVAQIQERINSGIASAEETLSKIKRIQDGKVTRTEGTRNFVIFDDKLITITHKNGEPVTAAERAQIVDELFALASGGEQVTALGQTDPYAEAISISVQAAEMEARKSGRSMRDVAVTAARHEALEFFVAHNIVTAQEWSALQRAALAEGWIDATGVREAYTRHYGDKMGPNQLRDLILKESIMEMYGRYRAGGYKPKGLIRKAFKRISDFIDRVLAKVRGEGFQTWEDIFQKVDAGEMKRRYEEIYGTGPVNQSAVDAVLAAGGQPSPMIRAGQIPDARGISQTPGAQAPARPQNMLQRARILPPDRPLRSLGELMNQARRAAGMTFRTGRIDPALDRMARQAARAAGGTGRGAHALGQYNGVARTRIHRDFDVFAHEMGHHIQRIGDRPLAALMVAHQSELNPLATPGPNVLSEGFAEFFRRYLTNETAARQHAPSFYQAFEGWLNAANPNLYAELNDIQTEYERFLLGDPVERGAAQQTVLVRDPGVIRRYLNDAARDGWVPTIGDRLHWMYHSIQQGVFDKHHGWMLAARTLLDEISQRTGQRRTLRVMDNPNKLIRKVSHTNAWAMMDLKEGIALESRPNGGGTSMHQVLARAFGSTNRTDWNETRLREFGNYLVARRAVHQYVRFNPAFRQQISQFVAANPQLAFLLPRLPTNLISEIPRAPTAEPLYEHLNALVEHEQRNPQFRAAAELYYDFNKDLIQLLYEKHLITREERDEYIQDRDYAPFQRNMDDREGADGVRAESKRPGRDRATINKHDVYRRLEGSVRDIINPIQSTVQTVYEVRLRAAVNDVLRALDRLARQAGPAGNEILERIPAHEARAMEIEIRQALRQAAIAAGMSPTDTAIMLANVESQIGPNAVTTMFAPQLASERGEKIVWFYENGKPVPAQLPDGELGRMMYEGLTMVGQRGMGALMEAMTFTAGTVRVGVTFSFGFIFRNILVDSIASWVNSPHARPLLTQAAGIREIVRAGESMHLYNRYAGMMGGLATNAISDQSVERDIEALRQRGFKVRRPRSFGDLLKVVFQVGEFSETATRVGIFRNAYRSAQADGLSDFEAAIEAGHAAHDVMDFSKHGSKTEWLRRIIPFFNAALIGVKKYVGTLTATNDYGNLIDIWRRSSQGLPLSENERRARGQAYKAMLISTAVLGPISLALAILGDDDDDMKEVPDSIRATHWRLSVDGVLWLLPKDLKTLMGIEDGDSDVIIRIPKPFEIAWFANAAERAWDALRDQDPRAAAGFASDIFATLIPPNSIPALDTAYGFVMGKDMYSGNDIVPFYEKGTSELERQEQYGPYTSWTARQIGGALNISPYYADFLVRNLFASVGSDAVTVIDSLASTVTDVSGPALSAGEYPVARRFTYNAGRTSQSLQKFYGMMTDGEGMKQWFWNMFAEDARSFHSAANTYRQMIERGGEDSPQAAEFLNRINPDQRAFAILSHDFKGETKGKYRNLHPMLNASEGVRVANNLMKEVVDGRVTLGKGTKTEEAEKLDRNQMRDLRNELGHVRRGIAQNALKIMNVEGWGGQRLMDVDARLDVIKSISPKVHEELMRRLSKEKFQDGKHLMKVWPDVKKRVDNDRKDAVLGDLWGPVVGK